MKLYKMFALVLAIMFFSGYGTIAAEKTYVVSNGVMKLKKIDIKHHRNIQLDGKWEFYWKKFLNHNNLKKNKPDILGFVPNTWDSYSIHGKRLPGCGYGTYRLRVTTDIPKNTLIGMETYIFSSAYKLYINGKLIGSNGKIGKSVDEEAGEYKPQILFFYVPDKSFDIIIQVSNFEYARGGFWHAMTLGSANDIIKLHDITIGKELFILGILLIVVLFYAAMYILQRDFKYCLYFSCMCFFMLISLDMVGQFIILKFLPKLDFKIVIFIWYTAVTWAVFFILLYIHELFKSKFSSIVVKADFYFSAIFQVMITFTPSSFYSRFGKVNNFINAVWVLCAIIMIIIGIKRGYKGAILNITSMICILAAYFHDVIYWDNKILDSFGETIYIGLFLAILAQMLTQARRIQEFHDKKTAAELSFLQAQIKPHFLYNTLNTFISISRYDAEKARNLLYDFSNYLRKSFDFKDLSQFVPLKDEIELAKAYTEIEKARHEEDVIVNFDVDEEINVNVPRLVLQPIIENAIKHGVLPKGECGTVDISIKKTNNKIIFDIKDNGVGIKEEKLKQIFKRDEKSRVGLLNIERRLKKLYGKGLQINSKEGIGTEITWEIPII